MKSGAKRQLSHQEIERLIGETLSETVRDSAELSDGWANSAYRIELGDGRSVIMKVAPPKDIPTMRYEKDIMQAEVAVLRLVGEQCEGVPVPAVLAHDDSLTLIDSEYFIMDCLSGTPFNKLRDSLSEAEQTVIDGQLGIFNRRINEMRGERFGLYAQPDSWRSSWTDAFGLMISYLLADAKDAGIELPEGYAAMERRIVERFDCLAEVKEPQLVLWDLWDGNVFVDNGRVSGLIDFERALWGDPLMESYFYQLGSKAAFLEGYGIKEWSEDQRNRRSLYDLYLDLVMWIECTYRRYENKGHIQWARDNLTQSWSKFLA